MKSILPSLAISGFICAVALGQNPFLERETTTSPERLERDAKAQFAIPEKYRKDTSVTLHLEKQAPDHLEYILVNPTTKTMQYDGTGVSQPFFQIQILKNGQWVAYQVFICGTGAYLAELKAGQACRCIAAPLPRKQDYTIRVGMEFQEAPAPGDPRKQEWTKIWSEPVDLKKH